MKKPDTGAIVASLLCTLLVGGGAFLGLSLFGQADMASNPKPSPRAAQTVEAEAEDDFPDVDWDWWKKENPDVIGWVTVPGAGIDLPICQARDEDPTFYLAHDAYGSWNIYGCPYLDAECAEKGFGSPLAMVFGHHMDDGSMFAAMASYSDKAFAQEHCEILLQTPEEKKRLHVAAADVVDTYNEFKRLDFVDRRDFLAWWEETLEGSDMVLDPNAADPENVHAFVTCSYGLWNGHERTIVYAVE